MILEISLILDALELLLICRHFVIAMLGAQLKEAVRHT
jgi:hypothetical protein